MDTLLVIVGRHRKTCSKPFFLHPRWVARSGSLMALLQKRPGNHGMFCRFWMANQSYHYSVAAVAGTMPQGGRCLWGVENSFTFVGFGWSWHIMATMILIGLERTCTKKGHYMSIRQWSWSILHMASKRLAVCCNVDGPHSKKSMGYPSNQWSFLVPLIGGR